MHLKVGGNDLEFKREIDCLEPGKLHSSHRQMFPI